MIMWLFYNFKWWWIPLDLAIQLFIPKKRNGNLLALYGSKKQYRTQNVEIFKDGVRF